MCKSHCLEYRKQRPYNTCRCEMLMEEHWQYNRCSSLTWEALAHRAKAFDNFPPPSFALLTFLQSFIDATGFAAENDIVDGIHIECPIPDCTRKPWLNAQLEWQVSLCRGCHGIFPSLLPCDMARFLSLRRVFLHRGPHSHGRSHPGLYPPALAQSTVGMADVVVPRLQWHIPIPPSL